MVKITIITGVSLSILLFSGYANSAFSHSKNKQLLSRPLLMNCGTSFKGTIDTALLKAGDKCPDFVFRDTTGYDGLKVKLSDLKGKYVLIDVWASWCAPCRAQYPHLVLLEEKMKDKAITFVSISIDSRVFRWKTPLLSQMGGIQWMARDEAFEKAFGINAIPRFILLDKNGNILKLKMPLPSHPELEQELSKLEGI